MFAVTMSFFYIITKLESVSAKHLLSNVSTLQDASISETLINVAYVPSKYNIADVIEAFHTITLRSPHSYAHGKSYLPYKSLDYSHKVS